MSVQIAQVRRIGYNDERIGMGFNSSSGLAVGTALQGFTVEEDPAAPGQRVTASVDIINSQEELMEKMGMSFEAEGRYGTISGSAKAQFSESTNYNSTSTFVLARCVVQNPFRRGQNFGLTQPASDLLRANNAQAFKTAFGDSFVRGLQTGGEFYAVIRITSISTSTQSELSASCQAEAQGLLASGGFKAAFSTANATAQTHSEYAATMYQEAGQGPQVAPVVSIDEVMQRFKDFPTIALNSAAAYQTEVATYDTIPVPMPSPEEQEDFVFALADARRQKLQFIQTRNDLMFTRQNPDFFTTVPPDQTLQDQIGVYTDLINAVFAHAIKLSRGQVPPDQLLFNPARENPPLTVPAPLVLQRKQEAPPPATPQVQVRNFLTAPLELPSMATVFCNRDGLHAAFTGPLEIPGPNGIPLTGLIVSQHPPAGSMVATGSVVTFDIGNYQDRHIKKLGRV
jgi:hypothetical protein